LFIEHDKNNICASFSDLVEGDHFWGSGVIQFMQEVSDWLPLQIPLVRCGRAGEGVGFGTGVGFTGLIGSGFGEGEGAGG